MKGEDKPLLKLMDGSENRFILLFFRHRQVNGYVVRVRRGIDAKTSIPTGKAKPALASQEPASTSRNGNSYEIINGLPQLNI